MIPTVDKLEYGFDYSQWWGDQDHVVVFHGTSVGNYEDVKVEGLEPSEDGHTAGWSFFSTSALNAWQYAHMGGEVASGGYHRLTDEECLVLAFEIPPHMLKGVGVFGDQAKFQRIVDHVKADPDQDTDWIMGEFKTADVIPPQMLVDVFRMPKGLV